VKLRGDYFYNSPTLRALPIIKSTRVFYLEIFFSCDIWWVIVGYYNGKKIDIVRAFSENENA